MVVPCTCPDALAGWAEAPRVAVVDRRPISHGPVYVCTVLCCRPDGTQARDPFLSPQIIPSRLIAYEVHSVPTVRERGSTSWYSQCLGCDLPETQVSLQYYTPMYCAVRSKHCTVLYCTYVVRELPRCPVAVPMLYVVYSVSPGPSYGYGTVPYRMYFHTIHPPHLLSPPLPSSSLPDGEWGFSRPPPPA